MIKYRKTLIYKSFALALAAAVAVTAAGCSGGGSTGSAPSDAPQAAAESAAVPADTSAAADTNAAAAASETDPAASATAAAAETADTSADDKAASDTETSSADSTAAAESADDDFFEDDIPERDKADTALKESVLSEALVECTGWGQSAGSSLRAALASVLLLQWANDVKAADADSALLADTVKTEVNRLSDVQQENLKENWSSISYDASMILDSYDEIGPVLEDAGCAEAAKGISSDKNSLANWEALEHALNAALK